MKLPRAPWTVAKESWQAAADLRILEGSAGEEKTREQLNQIVAANSKVLRTWLLACVGACTVGLTPTVLKNIRGSHRPATQAPAPQQDRRILSGALGNTPQTLISLPIQPSKLDLTALQNDLENDSHIPHEEAVQLIESIRLAPSVNEALVTGFQKSVSRARDTAEALTAGSEEAGLAAQLASYYSQFGEAAIMIEVPKGTSGISFANTLRLQKRPRPEVEWGFTVESLDYTPSVMAKKNPTHEWYKSHHMPYWDFNSKTLYIPTDGKELRVGRDTIFIALFHAHTLCVEQLKEALMKKRRNIPRLFARINPLYEKITSEFMRQYGPTYDFDDKGVLSSLTEIVRDTSLKFDGLEYANDEIEDLIYLSAWLLSFKIHLPENRTVEMDRIENAFYKIIENPELINVATH